MQDVLKRLPNENEAQYIFRIGQAKDNGIITETWSELSPRLNVELGIDETEARGESAWRKKYRNYLEAYEQIFSKQQCDESQVEEMKALKREIEKERVKIRDERTDYQKSIREAARRESFMDLVERTMSQVVEPFDYKPSPIIDGDADMIVCLSDIHAGIEVDNWWNIYNTKILKQRLNKYLDEIRDAQDTHKCKVCYIVLGGDNISGIIHNQLRLQNNENVIEQIKVVTTYIGEFIYQLQDWFDSIEVYSVAGNHSRINPNKDEHLKGEELDELIPFCLSLQFTHNDKVTICNDDCHHIDSTISAFKTRGNKLFYVVHGDKESPNNVVKNLTLMSGTKPDGIIMGHRHTNGLSSDHGVKIIQCGSTMGMDEYCVDQRISGIPEQCVIITSQNKTVKCFYDIKLN